MLTQKHLRNIKLFALLCLTGLSLTSVKCSNTHDENKPYYGVRCFKINNEYRENAPNFYENKSPSVTVTKGVGFKENAFEIIKKKKLGLPDVKNILGKRELAGLLAKILKKKAGYEMIEVACHFGNNQFDILYLVIDVPNIDGSSVPYSVYTFNAKKNKFAQIAETKKNYFSAKDFCCRNIHLSIQGRYLTIKSSPEEKRFPWVSFDGDNKKLKWNQLKNLNKRDKFQLNNKGFSKKVWASIIILTVLGLGGLYAWWRGKINLKKA